MAEPGLYAGIVAVAVIPPLLFLLWMRFTERYDREPYRWLLWSFVYGGTFGVVIAILLNEIGGTGIAALTDNSTGYKLLIFVAVAPFVEEFTKGIGLGTLRRPINEWEDGIIYGAGIGLGFAASENILYGFSVLADDGTGSAFTVLAVRTFSSTILHAGTTALLGFAFAHILVRGTSTWELLPTYLLAVAIHAGYNFLVAFTWWWIGLPVAIAVVWALLTFTRRRIRNLDALPHDQHTRM